MTITTKKTVEQQVQIPVPSFWKREDEKFWTALVDESTVISFSLLGNYVDIGHADPEFFKDKIEIAHSDYNLCTEQEWLDKYAEVLKSISLTPVLTKETIIY